MYWGIIKLLFPVSEDKYKPSRLSIQIKFFCQLTGKPEVDMDTLIPGIVLQWPCISNRRWMRLWGPTWWITVCFTALLSPSSIWACKKMAWDSPWGYRPCGCSATWIQLVTVACANSKHHACMHASIHTYTWSQEPIYMCAYTYTNTCTHTYVLRIDLCMNLCINTHTYICTHARTYTCSYRPPIYM